MTKKKKQGHYCKICGEYKANEKFSGKRHAQHVCKSCMSLKNKDISLVDEFFLDIDEFPVETSRETTRYKKLNKEQKADLKELIIGCVVDFWHEERQIPVADSLAKFKSHIIEVYDEECGTLLKDETEFKTYLQAQIISIINKQLKSEMSQ